jgi:hypothetical protein
VLFGLSLDIRELIGVACRTSFVTFQRWWSDHWTE